MGHVNNVKYVCWALDAIDEGVLRERLLKEILVNYDAEVLLGETVELYSIKQESEDELVYYMQGVVDGKSKFSVKLVF
jgi:acyl-ACP thioesterase